MSGLFASSGAELSALGSVFVKLLNISIAAGWIVLAAALLRKLLRRAPKWAVCLLWLVLALRLVLPFSIESSLSLVPSAETVVVTDREASAGSSSQGTQAGSVSPDGKAASSGVDVEIHSGFLTVNSFVNPIISGASGSDNTEQGGAAEPSAGADQTAKTARSAGFASLINSLGAAWAAGAVILFAYAAISWSRLHKKVRASMPWAQAAAGSAGAQDNAFSPRTQTAEPGNAAASQNFSRRLRVFVCDDIDTPFILGILRPAVYLPSGLSAAEAEHILSHEQAHITRRDQLWKPLGFALLTVYWFNPLMWLAYILFCRDIELACDEKVIRAMDGGSKAAYSRTLVSCSSRQRLVTACPLAFGETGTGERVRSVLSYRRPAFWIIGVAIVICIVLAVCFLTDPKRTNKEVQGQVYVWFDTIKDKETEDYSILNGEVSLPEYPDVTFRTDGKGIYMFKDGAATPLIQDVYPVRNAFFCDLNGDGKPELCSTCCFGSGIIDERIKVCDIVSGELYEISDRGNFDYTLTERNGWLIVMKRAYEKTSSVGSDTRLMLNKNGLDFAPLSDEARAAVQLYPEDLISGNSYMTGKTEQYIITIDGKKYYLVKKTSSYLPFGYTQVGTISKEQAGRSFVAGLPYYRAEGLDDIYVYSEHAVTPGDAMLSSERYAGYLRFSPDKDAVWTMTLDDVIFLADKRDLTRDDLRSFVTLNRKATKGENYSIRIDGMYTVFVRFDEDGKADMFKLFYNVYTEYVDLLKDDPRAFINAHCVVDIIDTAEVHDTALEKFWESGGLEFWFPSIQSESMYVVTADGNQTPLKTALENRLILVTDIPRFGFKVFIKGWYEGELTGLVPEEARLAQLKHYDPDFFGLNTKNGLTIYVYSLAEGHYACGLLPGDVDSVSLDLKAVSRDDILLILKYEYANVPDSKIRVSPYYNMLSSYLILNKEAYANELIALFGGRFELGATVKYSIETK